MTRALLLAIPLCLALTACAATPEPIIRTVEVRVPVAVACIPDELDQKPEYLDEPEALRDADPATRYALLQEGWFLRRARLDVLEGAVEGCR